MSKAVVLVSGGLDSCVVLAYAINKHGKENIYPLNIFYGQRMKGERRAINDIMAFYGFANFKTVDISSVANLLHSALTQKHLSVPHHSTVKDFDIPLTYVPFRNSILLSIAAGYTESISGNYIYIGAHQQDYSNYPDCRGEYFEAFNKMLEVANSKKFTDMIKVETPILNMAKDEIIKLGLSLNAPLHLTWSCYNDQDKPCLECPSCAIRQNAFKKLGMTDPYLVYNKLV